MAYHGRPQLFWKGRARGRHLTAAYTLSAFGRFNQWEGGRGLSAFGRTANSASGGAHVCKQGGRHSVPEGWGGGGGGGGGAHVYT